MKNIEEILYCRFPYTCYLISSDFSTWTYNKFNFDFLEIFVLFKEQDLTFADVYKRLEIEKKENKDSLNINWHTDLIAIATNTVYQLPFDEGAFSMPTSNLLKHEFEKKGKFKGYEVYCVHSNVKVWISYRDWNILQKFYYKTFIKTDITF